MLVFVRNGRYALWFLFRMTDIYGGLGGQKDAAHPNNEWLIPKEYLLGINNEH